MLGDEPIAEKAPWIIDALGRLHARLRSFNPHASPALARTAWRWARARLDCSARCSRSSILRPARYATRWALPSAVAPRPFGANFRGDHGSAIQAACAHFLVLCHQIGLLTQALAAVDGKQVQGGQHPRQELHRHEAEGQDRRTARADAGSEGDGDAGGCVTRRLGVEPQ